MEGTGAWSSSASIGSGSEAVQVAVFVGERGRVRPRLPRDQPCRGGELAMLVLLGVAAAIQADRRPQHAAGEIETDGLPLLRRATRYEEVPGARMARVLELVLVLVRPEGVDIGVLRVRAVHRPRGRRPLLLGVVVMLDADAAEQRVQVVGHVAGGEDRGDVRPAHRVNEHAVVDRDPRPLQDVHGRLDADRHDGEIAFQLASLLRDHPFEATGAFEADDLVAGDELDAGLAMDRCHQRADLGTKDRLERRWAGKYSADVHLHLRQRGGHLRTYEAHPGDQRARPRTCGLLDRIAIGHRAQLEYARQVGAGDVQAPVLAPCRDQQLRVTDGFPARQLDVAGAYIDA